MYYRQVAVANFSTMPIYSPKPVCRKLAQIFLEIIRTTKNAWTGWGGGGTKRLQGKVSLTRQLLQL